MSKIIGYTTGVFDLFHIGHLNLLRRAKDNCDYLVVGVSTDELVLKYKGKKPIIPFDERVEIVRAIRYVDEVVPQTTLKKIDAWEKIKFNKLFHGNDWKGTGLYNEIQEELSKVGVEMVFFQYTSGISSTKLHDILESYYHLVIT